MGNIGKQIGTSHYRDDSRDPWLGGYLDAHAGLVLSPFARTLVPCWEGCKIHPA